MIRPCVLMYHGIIKDLSDLPKGREEGAELYDVSLENFKAQMNLIKEKNYSVNLNYPEDVTRNKVVLTFDDGEKNNLTNAHKVLQQLKWPAYFFVTVNRIGTPGYMSFDELQKIRDTGMIVGSHGLNHNSLTELSDDELENELEESKDILEKSLKVNVFDLSIPRGFYNQKVIDMALEAGYKNIFVSEAAPKHLACIGRVAVKGDWTLERFSQALEGKQPVNEKCFDVGKGFVKGLLGSAGYNKIRQTLLRGKK